MPLCDLGAVSRRMMRQYVPGFLYIVKNTGRLRELLLPDADVTLQKADNPGRATAYEMKAALRSRRDPNSITGAGCPPPL